MVKARKENIRLSDAVRKALFCAFNAPPANSPSNPKRQVSSGDFFLRFNCNSPVFLIASSGVSLLNFLAGIHAEIHIVATVKRSVATKTNG